MAIAAIARSQKDLRFFKFLCEIRPGLLVATAFWLTAIPSALLATRHGILPSINGFLCVVVAILNLALCVMKIMDARGRFRRFVSGQE